jgi:glycosyltransferase involved in cell wall biosynthesis
MDVKEARVAWITPILGRADKLLYMGPLLRALASRCREFHVFTAEFGGDAQSAGFPITRGGAIRRVYRGMTADGIPLALPLIGPSILRSIHRYRADLMIVTEFSMLSLYSILLGLLRRKVKMLLIVENRPVSVEAGWKSHVRRSLRRLVVRHADAMLTNSASGKDYLIQQLHAPESRIVCRPYLVSDMASHLVHGSEVVAPARRRAANAPIHFLYVGRLIPSKGVRYALQACKGLLPSCHDRFRLDIVGEGEQRAELERWCAESGLSEHVRFHGQQPYESLKTFYRNADVFLFPTLLDYRALVSFEAISAGLAMLVSIHDGSVSETVAEGMNGYTFELTELMRRYIDEPQLIEEFSRQSLAMAVPYTLDNAIDALLAACRLALADNGRCEPAHERE